MLDVTRLRVIDAVARHGSVTAAARELSYSQPSVSHHLARLEAETGAQLLQRVGRGIRLTQAGQLLADRAAEIIGRIDAAESELSAHVGLTAGRVRLAGFSSAIGSLVPRAAATLARASRPGDRPDGHPSAGGARDAADREGRGGHRLPLRRDGGRAARRPLAPPARRPDVPAVQPPHARAGEPARGNVDRRLRTLPRPPARAVRRRGLRAAHRLRVRRHGAHAVARHGGALRSDAAGTGPARSPRRRIIASKLPGLPRRVYAATYGEPPDPPAVAALLAALADAAAAA